MRFGCLSTVHKFQRWRMRVVFIVVFTVSRRRSGANTVVVAYIQCPTIQCVSRTGIQIISISSIRCCYRKQTCSSKNRVSALDASGCHGDDITSPLKPKIKSSRKAPFTCQTKAKDRQSPDHHSTWLQRRARANHRLPTSPPYHPTAMGIHGFVQRPTHN